MTAWKNAKTGKCSFPLSKMEKYARSFALQTQSSKVTFARESQRYTHKTKRLLPYHRRSPYYLAWAPLFLPSDDLLVTRHTVLVEERQSKQCSPRFKSHAAHEANGSHSAKQLTQSHQKLNKHPTEHFYRPRNGSSWQLMWQKVFPYCGRI